MSVFESFFKEAKDLFATITLEKYFENMSPSWSVLLGWSAEELRSRPIHDFIHVEDRDRALAEYESQSTSGRHYIDMRFLHKNGHFRWLSWSFKKSESENRIFAVARDITDIRKNNLSLEALMASLDDLVFLIDESGLFIDLWTSNSSLLFLPKEELIGHHVKDIFGNFAVGFESVMAQSFRLNRSLSMEFQFPNKAGWFSAKVTPILKTSGQKRLASFLVRDITDKIEADQALDSERGKLLSASKMATLGEMAAGIAHEVNNPLAIIQGKAWLLKKHIDEDALDKKFFSDHLQAIHDTTVRISKIIHGLKTFARNADQDPFTEASIASILDDTLELCREKFKNHGIQLRVVGRRAPTLECRSVQLSQVVLNLLSNSFDAIEGTKNPWVELQIKALPAVLEISVMDSGGGISQPMQEKIMQPFFTTKEVGRGTGLGLSITKGIIETHHGEFFYDTSSVNTRFVIRLPYKQPQIQSQPA
jgi:PAS domain S-box-containing protein